MANDTNICEVHLFSISPNLHHYLTVLNTNAILVFLRHGVDTEHAQ